MKKYIEIKDRQAPMVDCFFAFSNSQLAKGIEEKGLQGKKIYKGMYGLYGTKDGIRNFLKFYEDMEKEIAQKCKPQDVYDYEFDNHECGYVGDDEEAINIVISYFGMDAVKDVKRKYAWKYV